MSHDCGYQYVATTELYLLVVRFPYIPKYATYTKIPIILHLQVLRLCDDEIAIRHIISIHILCHNHTSFMWILHTLQCVSLQHFGCVIFTHLWAQHTWWVWTEQLVRACVQPQNVRITSWLCGMHTSFFAVWYSHLYIMNCHAIIPLAIPQFFCRYINECFVGPWQKKSIHGSWGGLHMWL